MDKVNEQKLKVWGLKWMWGIGTKMNENQKYKD